MLLLPNNFLELESTSVPASSAISSTDAPIELNFLRMDTTYLGEKDFSSKEVGVEMSLPSSYPSSSSSSGAFGWGDFPLLQQSLVPVTPAPSSSSRMIANLHSERSPFEQDLYESSTLVSSSSSFDSMSLESCSSASLNSLADDEPPRSRGRCGERKVQFSKVQIREYSLTLGDHPWCEGGFPLSLDWKFCSQPDRHIDEYEHSRLNSLPSAQKLDVWERRNLLRRVAGYSTSELLGMERRRLEQQQRELLFCQNEFSSNSGYKSSINECNTIPCSAISQPNLGMLRHSPSLQNLSTACV